MAEIIKSKDACARCYWGIGNPGCPRNGMYNCDTCERHQSGNGCECVEIKHGTPCTVFREVKTV